MVRSFDPLLSISSSPDSKLNNATQAESLVKLFPAGGTLGDSLGLRDTDGLSEALKLGDSD